MTRNVPKYRADSPRRFDGRVSGVVYASEFNQGSGKSLHVRNPCDIDNTPYHLMAGIAPIKKGTTIGFIRLSKDERGNNEVDITYYCRALNTERYKIGLYDTVDGTVEGIVLAERDVKGWSGDIIYTWFCTRVEVDERKVRGVFGEIERSIEKLSRGEDAEVRDLGLEWLLV